METTFYHDDQTFSKETMKNLKKRMTLDFGAPPRPPSKQMNSGGGSRKDKPTALLSSPDLNMLKLASPELEKLIIAQNGVVTTTPTPTQFIFPKNVTMEQELYARGFVDALAELHHSSTGSNSSNSTGLPDIAVSSAAPTTVATSYNGAVAAANSACGGGGGGEGSNGNGAISSIFSSTAFPPSPSAVPALLPVHVKEEPQTVPSLGATPPLSPIDMESQERIKLERKRQRNRIAASKCRKRKLERIARLEDKVKDLKGENTQLGSVVNKLRDQVCQLKQQVMEHIGNGCQIMLSSGEF